jgi:hypothetical protein
MNLSLAGKKIFIIVLAHAHAIELLPEVQHPQDRLAVVTASVSMNWDLIPSRVCNSQDPWEIKISGGPTRP